MCSDAPPSYGGGGAANRRDAFHDRGDCVGLSLHLPLYLKQELDQCSF